MLWWNELNEKGALYQQYLPFQTIDDLVDQFNYVGYHDVCIYPLRKDLTMYDNIQAKGVTYVHYGHAVENQTGK